MGSLRTFGAQHVLSMCRLIAERSLRPIAEASEMAAAGWRFSSPWNSSWPTRTAVTGGYPQALTVADLSAPGVRFDSEL